MNDLSHFIWFTDTATFPHDNITAAHQLPVIAVMQKKKFYVSSYKRVFVQSLSRNKISTELDKYKANI